MTSAEEATGRGRRWGTKRIAYLVWLSFLATVLYAIPVGGMVHLVRTGVAARQYWNTIHVVARLPNLAAAWRSWKAAEDWDVSFWLHGIMLLGWPVLAYYLIRWQVRREQ